jgi:hypothetical protein
MERSRDCETFTRTDSEKQPIRYEPTVACGIPDGRDNRRRKRERHDGGKWTQEQMQNRKAV